MRQAIDGARAILPLVEQRHADQLGPVRDTLSQLQMAYSQLRGQGGGEEPPSGEGGGEGGGGRRRTPEQPEGPGPRSRPGASGSPASRRAGPPCRLTASERRPLAAAPRVSRLHASLRSLINRIPEGLPCKIS